MAGWRMLAWRGTDPDRIEAAQVMLGEGTLRARGSTTAAGHVLDWVLDCGADWVTQRLSVRARGDGWARSLDVTQAGGTWHARRSRGDAAHEDVDLGPLGLDEALDCDLALCPFTNVMPILRHDLVGAAHAGLDLSVDLVMAWVDVPTLTVHRSPQRYTARGPVGDGGAAIIEFASEGFTAEITVDSHGFVVDYPAIGTRIVP
jgi:uncharacterized protein